MTISGGRAAVVSTFTSMRLFFALLVGCGSPSPSQPTLPLPAPQCPTGMVHVPAGRFMMPIPEGVAEAKHGREHEERLAGYCIDRTEVTAGAYASCVAKGRCTPTATHDHRDCTGARADRGDHPINCVDWNQALAYCNFAGKRLPTEAEWAYAARGADGRKFPWGNEPPTPKRLNACGRECVTEFMKHETEPLAPGEKLNMLYDADDGWATTSPVGAYPTGASPFGALDMAGNVEEWTTDGLHSNGQSLAEARAGRRNMIIVGGDYYSVEVEQIGPDRGGIGRSEIRPRLGFRCVRSE